MNQLRASRPKGFSLIELGIVLAVVGIASLFVISKLGETNVSRRAQNASRDLNQIITNIQRLYSTRQSYPNSTFDTNVLINNNVFPASWLNPNRTLNTPFGGTFTSGSIAPDQKRAVIIIDRVPSKVCAELGQLIIGDVLGMWVGVGANRQFPKHPDTPLSINMGNLGTGCTAAAYVEMAFYFGRN